VRSPHPGAPPLLLPTAGRARWAIPRHHRAADRPAPPRRRLRRRLPRRGSQPAGFGFSGPVPDSGWDTGRIGRAWAELMRRLSYHRYAVRRRRSPASEACTWRAGDKDGQSEDDGQRLGQIAVLSRSCAGPAIVLLTSCTARSSAHPSARRAGPETMPRPDPAQGCRYTGRVVPGRLAAGRLIEAKTPGPDLRRACARCGSAPRIRPGRL